MVEKQVTSLELSKKLKEAGYKQEGLWWWFKFPQDRHYEIIPNNLHEENDFYKRYNPIIAPTVAELGEALPKRFPSMQNDNINEGYKAICYCMSNEADNIKPTYANTEANARAKMWLYLKENKLLEA